MVLVLSLDQYFLRSKFFRKRSFTLKRAEPIPLQAGRPIKKVTLLFFLFFENNIFISILFQFGGPTTDPIPRIGGRFVHHFS